MKFYIKYLLIFLKATVISLVFGASWVVSFYGLDTYATHHVQNYRSDFFLEIIIFFLSGLIGAMLFLLLMRLIGFITSLLHSKP
ncbi:hypothetical protein [Kordia sp.]|uniref:hypothetical protein n=1 Tax=Kordia sp. TaxID=1965332 RepID=UPI003D2C5A52